MGIKFQILDADYFLNGAKPVIRLFGKTENGNAICAMFDSLLPYFFAEAKDTEEGKEFLKKIRSVVSVENVERKTPIGYCPEPKKMFKITLSNPKEVPDVREKLNENENFTAVYEADVLFKNRFMIDNGLFGMQWVEAEGTHTKTEKVKVPAYYCSSIKPIEGKHNAPLRYMALDIECISTNPNRPPEAEKDPIVMIALSFYPDHRGKKDYVLLAKRLKNKDTLGFENEKAMLEELVKIIDDYDPDIITGYNINLFDMPYILERLRQNRVTTNFSRCDKSVFSKSYGNTQEHVVPGRVIIDPYQILKRDPWVKFVRYNLNTVSKILLGEEKHDVEYKEMIDLWNGNQDDLVRFVEYSRKDAELSLRLLTEKKLTEKFFELSKISGLFLTDTFGGQAKRVETMLMHEFKKHGFVMPLAPNEAEMTKRKNERHKRGLIGATVLEPDKGLHADGCVLVLDFKSLYPSIMRTYNVSPDTVLLNEENVKSHESPTGANFVDVETYEGILPNILTGLIEMRSEIKKEIMKTASPDKKTILTAKQLAIKDMSNSFYGYTGYVRARLYMLDVANTITGYGRKNLLKTKDLIETKYKRKIIYADTDSAFIKTDIKDLDEARKLGEDIGNYITDKLPGKLELEFEKLYRTFLIMAKKRYAGWKFEYYDGKWEDKLEMKGIETVRRDWCPLVSEVMNEVLDTVLKEGDLKKAMEIIRKVLKELKENKIPVEKLTIVKGITKSVDSYEGMLPHIELARKLSKRNPHDPPKIGDRLGFVIIRGNQMLSKRSEDPKYVTENNLQIDADYYMQSQLLPPVERILNAVGIERTELMGGGHQASLGDILSGAKRKMKHTIELSYDNKKSEETVLTGVEDFICEKCKKSYRRISLTGHCECGGKILMSSHGSMGNRAVVGKIDTK